MANQDESMLDQALDVDDDNLDIGALEVQASRDYTVGVLQAFGNQVLKIGHGIQFHVKSHIGSGGVSGLEKLTYAPGSMSEERFGIPIEPIRGGLIYENFKALSDWVALFLQGKPVPVSIPIYEVTEADESLGEWLSVLPLLYGQIVSLLTDMERFNAGAACPGYESGTVQKTTKGYDDRLEEVVEMLSNMQASSDRKHDREMTRMAVLQLDGHRLQQQGKETQDMVEANNAMTFQLSNLAVDSDAYRVVALDFVNAWRNCLADPNVPSSCKNTTKTLMVGFPPSWAWNQDRARAKLTAKQAACEDEKQRREEGQTVAKKARLFRLRKLRKFSKLTLNSPQEDSKDEFTEKQAVQRVSERILPPAPAAYQLTAADLQKNEKMLSTEENEQLERLLRKRKELSGSFDAPTPRKSNSGGSYTGPATQTYEEYLKVQGGSGLYRSIDEGQKPYRQHDGVNEWTQNTEPSRNFRGFAGSGRGVHGYRGRRPFRSSYRSRGY